MLFGRWEEQRGSRKSSRKETEETGRTDVESNNAKRGASRFTSWNELKGRGQDVVRNDGIYRVEKMMEGSVV